MTTNRTCPKCHTGNMHTISGRNYRCELCGHTYYEAPPRGHVSPGVSSRIREVSREFNQSHSRELDRLRKAEKQRRQARRKQENRSAGVIVVPWLLSQFLS